MNHWPPACKTGALPVELSPHSASAGNRTRISAVAGRHAAGCITLASESRVGVEPKPRRGCNPPPSRMDRLTSPPELLQSGSGLRSYMRVSSAGQVGIEPTTVGFGIRPATSASDLSLTWRACLIAKRARPEAPYRSRQSPPHTRRPRNQRLLSRRPGSCSAYAYPHLKGSTAVVKPVRVAGLEPARPQGPADFKSAMTTKIPSYPRSGRDRDRTCKGRNASPGFQPGSIANRWIALPWCE